MITVECPQCQKVCSVERPGAFACPSCSAPFEVAAPEATPTPLPPQATHPASEPAAAQRQGPAWETESLGRLPAALPATLVGVIFRPGRLFSTMTTEASAWRSVWFVALCSVGAGLLGFVFQMLAETMAPGSSISLMTKLEQQFKLAGAPMEALNLHTLAVALGLFAIMCSPIQGLINAAVWGALLHLSVGMVGTRRGSFETTFRASALLHGGHSLLSRELYLLPLLLTITLLVGDAPWLTWVQITLAIVLWLAQQAWLVWASGNAMSQLHGLTPGQGFGSAAIALGIGLGTIAALACCAGVIGGLVLALAGSVRPR